MLNVKPQLTGQFVAVQVAGLETLILSVINLSVKLTGTVPLTRLAKTRSV